MFVVHATDITYKDPETAQVELPNELTLGVDEPINNEYLDTELLSHVEEIVGHPVASLKYSWTYDPKASLEQG